MVDNVTYFAFIFKLVKTPRGVCCGGGGGGGGGYSDIFIHTYGLDHFLGFKILKFNICLEGGGGGSENMKSFGGMKKLWIFLGDHYIIGLI